MRLAEYTDYTLRVLPSCAARPNRLIGIAETFDRHRASKAHPMKTVSDLARQEVIETNRGHSSGLHLLERPGDISIGDIDRSFEPDFTLAECFH